MTVRLMGLNRRAALALLLIAGSPAAAAEIILSDFGNLEVVAVTKNGTLQHWWRQEGGWRTDVTFGSNGVLQGSLGFVQDANGFFQVVVAETGGGLRHY